MLKSKTHLFQIALLVLFSASCANSQKRGFAGAQKPERSGMQIQSPLSNEQSLIKELTGKVASNTPTQEQLKSKPLSTQHYFAGVRAAESKNYIMAIKHYNTVLKKYPRSPEVKAAFAAKAKVYKEMGLSEPANLNMRMSQGQILKPALNKTSRATASASAVVAPQGKTKLKR